MIPLDFQLTNNFAVNFEAFKESAITIITTAATRTSKFVVARLLNQLMRTNFKVNSFGWFTANASTASSYGTVLRQSNWPTRLLAWTLLEA